MMKLKIFNKLCGMLLILLVYLLLRTDSVYAESTAKIHYITLPGNTEAILLESNGRFGMVDSGEDSDYPDGSDPRYPLRRDISIGVGYEDEVIAYLRSVGVTTDNFDFYIGTHAHSDHIGSADEIIREFQPDRVYIQEYKDAYITSTGNLWDNLYCYDNLIQAAKDVGATIIQSFDPSLPTDDYADADENSGTSDGMETDDTAAEDQVDPDNTSDPNSPAVNGDEEEGGKTGKFDDISGDSSVANPVFRLGRDMTIEIVHYGNNTEPKPDDNYHSLGVLVSANGKSAFLSGDINNYDGTETALAAQLGHVDILTLGHHGNYGSNTYSYVHALSPSVMVLPGSFSSVSNHTEEGGEIGTLDTLYSMSQAGVPLYCTDWYRGTVSALVFQLDSNLSNNIPTGLTSYAVLRNMNDPFMVCYRDGFPFSSSETITKSGMTAAFYDSWYSTNEWVDTSQGAKYRLYDGTFITSEFREIDDIWYYFDADGLLARKQWQKIDGEWYYFNARGHMQTGWLWEDGDWYYLQTGGAAVRNDWCKIDGDWYFFNSSGRMRTGWKKSGANWFYLKRNGKMAAEEWQKDDGKWYYFNTNGHLQTEWLRDGSDWYYLTPVTGGMKTGWQKIDGSWYYMHLISGRMQTEWQKVYGIWYYFDPTSGRMQKGWLEEDDSWYYLDPTSGQMQTGWQFINGSWYYLHATSGRMKTGWMYSGSVWYYFEENGTMAAGSWKDIDGSSYYFYNSGEMAASTSIDGYTVGSDGAYIG